MVTFLDILFFAHVRASARDTNFGFFFSLFLRFYLCISETAVQKRTKRAFLGRTK